MIVRESLNFERGQDPKKTMDIGLERQIIKELLDFGKKMGIGSIGLQKSGGDLTLWIADYGARSDEEFRNMVNKSFGSEYFSNIYAIEKKGTWKSNRILIIKPEYHNVFKNVFDEEGYIKESLNFERGLEPKQAMGIGRSVRVYGDRGQGIFSVILLEKDYLNTDDDEEVWKAKIVGIIKDVYHYNIGDIVYVIKFEAKNKDEIWGSIDPFINNR